jgi:hypothetical protein
MLQVPMALFQNEAAGPIDTFSLKTIVAPVITFLLGLLAKFAYDLWKERRKRKLLLFTKTIVSSFSLSDLDEGIRKAIEVVYQGHHIKSITLVEVEVENTGFSTVKNQAVTISFSEEAQIIGELQEIGSSEDFRYVKPDDSATKPNSRRFLLEILRKGKVLVWRMAVINHQGEEFKVEHGVVNPDSKQSDLEVDIEITKEKARIGFAVRIQKMIALLIYIQILYLARGIIPRPLLEFDVLISPLINVAIIWLWLLLLREATQIVLPVIQGVASLSGKSKEIGITSGNNSNIVIAEGSASLEVHTDKELLRALIPKAESLPEDKNLPKNSQ